MSNNGGVYTWSKTAAANAGADNTINWMEGQAPSSLNDSGRALMASVAKFRDDISGAIVTTGISVAYIVASNQIFDTLADFHGQMICFSPHVTNGAGPVTVTVDGFANLPLRTSPGKELLQGTIIQGTPYAAIYNNTDGSLYLQGFYGNPYNVPLAGGMPFFASTAPNSCFVFPFGQAISRTTYSALFALVGGQYGSGDGTNTFNLPDLRGRTLAGKDDMGGSAASRLTSTYFGTNAALLGATGGSESHTLTIAEMAQHSHANTLNDPGHAHHLVALSATITNGTGSSFAGVRLQSGVDNNVLTDTQTTGITLTNANTGSSNAHAIVQPTIVCNYIMRII